MYFRPFLIVFSGGWHVRQLNRWDGKETVLLIRGVEKKLKEKKFGKKQEQTLFKDLRR